MRLGRLAGDQVHVAAAVGPDVHPGQERLGRQAASEPHGVAGADGIVDDQQCGMTNV